MVNHTTLPLITLACDWAALSEASNYNIIVYCVRINTGFKMTVLLPKHTEVFTKEKEALEIRSQQTLVTTVHLPFRKKCCFNALEKPQVFWDTTQGYVSADDIPPRVCSLQVVTLFSHYVVVFGLGKKEATQSCWWCCVQDFNKQLDSSIPAKAVIKATCLWKQHKSERPSSLFIKGVLAPYPADQQQQGKAARVNVGQNRAAGNNMTDSCIPWSCIPVSPIFVRFETNTAIQLNLSLVP